MTLEAYVEVGGATRLWTMTGGQGIPAVFNHGGPGGYDELGPPATLIDDVTLVHRYDQRGGGRSPSAGPFSIQRFVADLERLRRYWRHERWIVVGHSWGAHLALFYALEHPARVAGLIFISGPPITWGWGSSRREQRLPRLTAEERLGLADLEERLARGPDERGSRRLREVRKSEGHARRAAADYCVRRWCLQPNRVAAWRACWHASARICPSARSRAA